MSIVRAGALCAISLHLVAVACLAVPLAARATGSATGDCTARTGAFRERLESVTEAVIDGRLAAVPAAADRAQAWWRLHGGSLGAHASADSIVFRLKHAAQTRDAKLAAHLAVELSTQSLAWCEGALSIPDQLMVLDLAGMAAWLRAKGVATHEPPTSREVARTVAEALQRGHHEALAVRLRAAYAAVQSPSRTTAADIRSAVLLLDLVDEIEKVLH